MSKIMLTGDVHGSHDVHKFSSMCFDYKGLDKNDYVIILGDFGFLWTPYPSKEELYWLNWFDQQAPWTTLVVDGNHENHERYPLLPDVDMFGSKVGRISKSVFHLRRGHIYDIPDINGSHSFFVMGGARSTDKAYRTEGKSWWRDEIPTCAQFELGLQNLEVHDWKVDYIISHTGPASVIHQYLCSIKADMWDKTDKDPVAKYFDNVCAMTNFKRMYFGHMHDNWVSPDGKYHMLYNHIVDLGNLSTKGLL